MRDSAVLLASKCSPKALSRNFMPDPRKKYLRHAAHIIAIFFHAIADN
jgi:hypothetical protein